MMKLRKYMLYKAFKMESGTLITGMLEFSKNTDFSKTENW